MELRIEFDRLLVSTGQRNDRDRAMAAMAEGQVPVWLMWIALSSGAGILLEQAEPGRVAVVRIDPQRIDHFWPTLGLFLTEYSPHSTHNQSAAACDPTDVSDRLLLV